MTGRRFPMMWVNGHPYPDPIHIATFTGEVYTEYQLGAVVVADDTGELRTRGPVSWITYAGAFPGSPTVVVWGAFDPATMQFTTGGAVDGIVIPDTALSGAAGTMSLGAELSTDIGGYASVVGVGFVVAGTAVPVTTTQLSTSGAIVNVAELIDAATGDHIETADGEEVFGLLQSLTGSSDGDAAAANPVENLQISFVYRTKANPAVLALYTMDAATTCYFRLRKHWYLSAVPYEAFVTGSVGELEILTQVFRIPTFTGAVYTDYPLASLVIAEDTGEKRSVGPASWGMPESVFGTPVTTATYTTTATDRKLKITRTLTGACLVTIRTADIVDGRVIQIRDDGLNCSVNNITIVGQAGELINGMASLILNRDGESAVLSASGGALFID